VSLLGSQELQVEDFAKCRAIPAILSLIAQFQAQLPVDNQTGALRALAEGLEVDLLDGCLQRRVFRRQGERQGSQCLGLMRQIFRAEQHASA
jgi:hypothetical protein